jgi:hypothetical protein
LESAGLIDRRQMSDLLTEQQLIRAAQPLPAVLSCLIVEGWLRTACSAPRQATVRRRPVITSTSARRYGRQLPPL